MQLALREAATSPHDTVYGDAPALEDDVDDWDDERRPTELESEFILSESGLPVRDPVTVTGLETLRG